MHDHLPPVRPSPNEPQKVQILASVGPVRLVKPLQGPVSFLLPLLAGLGFAISRHPVSEILLLLVPASPAPTLRSHHFPSFRTDLWPVLSSTRQKTTVPTSGEHQPLIVRHILSRCCCQQPPAALPRSDRGKPDSRARLPITSPSDTLRKAPSSCRGPSGAAPPNDKLRRSSGTVTTIYLISAPLGRRLRNTTARGQEYSSDLLQGRTLTKDV